MIASEVRRPAGMRAFLVIWFGQIISLLGSAMTGFAVTIWVFEGTGKATALALTGFFYVTPLLLLSPVAGAIVDRYNRRLMMMVSDLGAGLSTIAILILYLTGNLEVWHLFVTNAINGAFQTFQWPAFSAAISVMLPKEHYGRANGMMELAGSGSNIFAPVLAGALIVPLGLTGILLIDIVTFVFAIGALLIVHIPQPETSATGQAGQGSLLEESLFGFRYIARRPSLLGLQLVFLVGNFLVGLAFAIFAAMILARTGNNELVFGSVQSVAAVGGVLGGLAMAAWGGPKRRVHGVLAGWAVSGAAVAVAGFGRSLPVWAAAGFVEGFLVPIINGSNQAIWQAKVAPDVQGRVFSARRLIAWFVNPISALMAGPLADLVLEPAMQPGGFLANPLGLFVGTGSGAGMGLLFVLGGGLAAMVGLAGYAVRAIRNAEDILPDHDTPEARAMPEPAPTPSAWSPGRKVALALSAIAVAVLIVGLGWLQVQVMSASEATPDEAAAADVAAVSGTDVAPETSLPVSSPVATSLPSPEPTLVPTQPPTTVPTVTRPAPTPTPPPPTATPLPVLLAGDVVTYSFTVVNNGPADAPVVVVSDTLPVGVLFYQASTSQGAGCGVLPGGAEEDAGETVICELGTLPSGASAAVQIAVTVDPLAAGVLTNTVVAGAHGVERNPADNVLQRTHAVYAEADLVLEGGELPVVVAGAPFSYTLVATNQGPLAATDVTITSGLSAGAKVIAANADQGGSCQLISEPLLPGGTGALSCDVGPLARGQRVTVTVVAMADPALQGVLESLAQVKAPQTDLHGLDNSLGMTVPVQIQADVGILQGDGGTEAPRVGADLGLASRFSGPVVAGQPLTLTLTVANTGPERATGIVLTDTLAPGMTLVSGPREGQAVCTAAPDGGMSCYLGSLEAGASTTITLGMAVDSAATGGGVRIARVEGRGFDPDEANNSNSQEFEILAPYDLSIR